MRTQSNGRIIANQERMILSFWFLTFYKNHLNAVRNTARIAVTGKICGFLSLFFSGQNCDWWSFNSFFLFNWLKSQKNEKKKLATFLPACFWSEFAVLEIGSVWILMLLPFLYYLFVQKKIENIKKNFFRAIKTERGGGFKIVPETTSDNIFLYHIKMQVGVVALSLPPLRWGK